MSILQVSFSEINLHQNLQQKIKKLKDFNELRISETPSTLKATELIQQPWFLQNFSQFKSFYSLNFIINGDFNETDLPNPKLIKFSNKILITFESTFSDECQIMWKIDGESERVFSMKILRKFLEIVKDFIGSEIRGGNKGILRHHQTFTPSLQHLVDSRDFNLLFLAVEKIQISTIKDLISLKKFNLNEKIDGISPIDIAWFQSQNTENPNLKIQIFEIILTLLNENSNFPNGFDVEKVPLDVKNFTETSIRLHNLITTHDDLFSNNSEEIAGIVTGSQNLRHFFNLSNESAPFVALKHSKFDIYQLLVSKNVIIARTDPAAEISQILQNFTNLNKKNFREFHKKNARELPEKHLMKLIVNSFTGSDDEQSNDRLIQVSDAFNTLNKIPEIQPILHLVSNAEKFEIFFDFYRNSVEFMDPTSDSSTNGKFYFSGVIYVAAGGEGMLGVLAHELCHYAMYLTYRNSAKPYQKGDLNAVINFNEIAEESMRNSGLEDIVRWVFVCYDEDVWHAELIVRIPHMLAHYHGNEERIEFLTSNFPSLFNFYRVVVATEVQQSILPMKKLTESKKSIKWSDLTPQLQSAVKHEEIIFQGEIISLFSIVGENSTVYENLNSEQIVRLIESEYIEVSKVVEWDLKFFIERNLINRNSEFGRTEPYVYGGRMNEGGDSLDQNEEIVLENQESLHVSEDSTEIKEMKATTFNKSDNEDPQKDQQRPLSNEPSNSLQNLSNSQKNDSPMTLDELITSNLKIILISDYAGSGKTTALKKLNDKLKTKFPSTWVEFIDLKRHFEAYKTVKNEFRNSDEICTFLTSNLLKLEEPETSIFTQLFKLDKVVFLFDGVDEISPAFNKFANALFGSIKNFTKNIQWISTRPECVDSLEKTLETTGFKFLPYSKYQKSKFVKKYLKKSGFSKEKIDEKLKFADDFIKRAEDLGFNGSRDVSNPLMLQLIAEASADENLSNSLNFYSIVNWFITKKLNLMIEKGEIVQKDKDSSILKSMTLMQVHQVYSLQLNYFSSEYYFQLEIFLKKIDWTYEEINRFGILHIENPDFFTFAHRIFAEFFCARFLIDGIYELKDKPSREEAELRVELLIYTAKYSSEVTNFLLNYLDLDKNSEDFPEIFVEIVIEKQKRIFLEKLISGKDVENITRLLRRSQKAINAIWMLEEEQTILNHSLNKETIFNYYEVAEIASKCLTPLQNSHLFNVKNQHGNILYYLWSNNEDRSESENLPKIQKMFNIQHPRHQEAMDHLTFLGFLNTVEKFLSKIEMREIFLKNSMKILSTDLTNFEELKEFWQKIEKILTKDEIKNFLLGENSNFQLNFFHFESAYSCGLIEAANDENFFEFLLTQLEKYLEKSEIFSLIFTANDLKYSTLMKTISNNFNENYKNLWIFIEKNLSLEERKKILSQVDKQKVSALHFAINSNNIEIFNYFKKVYSSHFTSEEIQEILIDHFYFQVPFSELFDEDFSLEYVEMVIEYLNELFKESKQKIVEILTREGYEWNVFSKFGGVDEKTNEKLKLFATFVGKFES